ncbi:hypothetical protein GW819_01015 [Candidatus Gracilibacteria bacterium]|nr:hypothetical protein [bacterium]NDK19401.1 hypothetical protein [Candidatus Gracilibacteria bacterium]OIO77365.1 MAG: hypothetical protein AUJ87_01440 [Candidatus Gracilibacteria bacterium CG1_02_38_174]PIQ12076.1 MAG: hypothetical protein COW68_01040 [Candidatus Gracilibacteria bacterium CG18_big_fil_WC_8_21_14_2_50_38_16]PIQ42259.1 MAG: hypothetical protein COW06_00275 [Candidatus Gracilibacteria bacterium CG12_big_fil_rev_8_21_14_0_65_38_15]PIZ01368.1 MAG: hypothetical protein COY60_0397
MNKFTLLLLTLFCITSSFFVGYYFGKSLSSQEIDELKNSLQISLRLHGNTLDVEKSHSEIRVIIDGKILSGTGSIELKK